MQGRNANTRSPRPIHRRGSTPLSRLSIVAAKGLVQEADTSSACCSEKEARQAVCQAKRVRRTSSHGKYSRTDAAQGLGPPAARGRRSDSSPWLSAALRTSRRPHGRRGTTRAHREHGTTGRRTPRQVDRRKRHVGVGGLGCRYSGSQGVPVQWQGHVLLLCVLQKLDFFTMVSVKTSCQMQTWLDAKDTQTRI